MVLKKRYFALEDAAKILSCPERDLLQLASYGQIELCILLPRGRITPVIKDEQENLVRERRILATHCGPCALYPLQWRAFVANSEHVVTCAKRIYAEYPQIERMESKAGFVDWVLVPEKDAPLKIKECSIVVRAEELDRVSLEQKSGNKTTSITENTLLSVIAALLANWPNGKAPSGKDLERAAASVGISISDDSIRKALKAANELSANHPA